MDIHIQYGKEDLKKILAELLKQEYILAIEKEA